LLLALASALLTRVPGGLPDMQIHTGWLDELIASEFKTEKPDLWLVLACGAVFQAHAHFLVRPPPLLSLTRG
jgi:hypothetical protein